VVDHSPPDDDAAVFRKLTPRTFRRDVAASIRAAILDGTLRSGAPLVERRIAQEMGVSRAPIREALRLLEEEGLVVTFPYKGTYVTHVSPRMVDEILSLRTALDAFAAERALPRLRHDGARHMTRLQRQLLAAAERADEDELVELHLAFHRAFYELADHDLLLQFWTTMESQMRLYDRVHQRAYASLQEYAEAHQRIVDVLATGNLTDLKKILVEHITENVSQLLPHANVQEQTT
jgi:DNA-binding GntR family transcriptional regulator